MNKKNTEKIKALFESIVLCGLCGGFHFDENDADEVNKAVCKLFRYIHYLENENNNLKEFADDLLQMLPKYEPCSKCNGYGNRGYFSNGFHISLLCEECKGEGVIEQKDTEVIQD